ncbi:MAG: anthranilate synthase component I family protein [Phycisphaerales bacterium]
MPTTAHNIELPCEQALAAWPPGLPLVALWSGDSHPASRWTLLGRPSHVREVPADQLDQLPAHTHAPKPGAGWVACLSYELGCLLEPAAGRPRGSWPLLTLARCEDAWLHDGLTGTWSPVGNPPRLDPPGHPRAWHVGSLTSELGEAGYTRRVARAVEYIHAGDVYQVNLAHRLHAPFTGSARAFFREWAAQSRAWYGAYMEWDSSPSTRRAVLSASPELFLSLNPATRRLVTRPMKGTRPAGRAVGELEHSAKDRAELAMIVDLMRNDLGRVCDLGSIRVDQPRAIESHTGLGVLQATATVSGTLAPGRSWWDAIRATFPGGSVTGAPKVRAMQIIQELEPSPRGPYCGCIGFIGDDGSFQFNIAIRTAVMEGTPDPATLDGFTSASIAYNVGAGIVADSSPAAEWQETLDKANAFVRAATHA